MQFILWKALAVVGSIMVVVHPCDLKTTQMNMQCSLIQDLMLYEFKLGDNTAGATKNICCVKSQSTVDHRTVS